MSPIAASLSISVAVLLINSIAPTMKRFMLFIIIAPVI